MTVINFAFIDAPTAAASGTVEVRPLRRTVGDTSVLVTAPIVVTIAAGAGTVTLDGAATVYWQFREKLTGVPTGEQVWRTYQIPASGTVAFPSASVIEIDKYSLDPLPEPGTALDAEIAFRIAGDAALTAADVVLTAAAAAALAAAAASLQPAAIGTTVQAFDADLTSWAGIAPTSKADAPTSWADLTGGLAKYETTALVPPQERLWAGWVELAGRVTVNPAGITATELVCVLPAGHRPAVQRRIIIVLSSGAVSTLLVATTGNVTIPGTVSGISTLDLDGARFRV